MPTTFPDENRLLLQHDHNLSTSSRAVRLLTAAQRICHELPPFLPPGDQAEYTRMIQTAQRSLSAEDFADAWNAGAALTTQQAVAFALAPSAA